MPRVKRSKWYAVRKGREGPRVYESWEECEQMVGPLQQFAWSFTDARLLWGCCFKIHRYPNAEYKGFMTREQAVEWILPVLHGLDAPSHLSQLVAGPSSSENVVGALVAEATPRMDARMECNASADPDAMKLSDEQQYVLDLVKQGYNVFFTGSAGESRFILFFVFLS